LPGARFLFDEWRDPTLTGLELFQRTIDWASHYDLPISTADRSFTLPDYAAIEAALSKRFEDQAQHNQCYPDPRCAATALADACVGDCDPPDD
jgi:hypothetical protein